jgi:hypothetical protein
LRLVRVRQELDGQADQRKRTEQQHDGGSSGDGSRILQAAL